MKKLHLNVEHLLVRDSQKLFSEAFSPHTWIVCAFSSHKMLGPFTSSIAYIMMQIKAGGS